jgi:hypothetical protein
VSETGAGALNQVTPTLKLRASKLLFALISPAVALLLCGGSGGAPAQHSLASLIHDWLKKAVRNNPAKSQALRNKFPWESKPRRAHAIGSMFL